MAAYPSERTILVSKHVAEAMRDRTRDPRPIRVLMEKIEEWVRCGLQSGNALDHKPEGFVLWGSTRNSLPKGQRFVWCGDEPRFGFIVDRRPDGIDLVKTTLVRVGVRR